jgi:hypothetical protein
MISLASVSEVTGNGSASAASLQIRFTGRHVSTRQLLGKDSECVGGGINEQAK